MKYFIGEEIFPISLDRFNELKNSRNILASALSVEEKYDIIMHNYLEFEQEILTMLAKNIIICSPSYYNNYELTNVLNRRVANLLTSVKMYQDQVEKHVRTCMKGNCIEGEKVKRYFRCEYDKYSEYRFMEALRNHVQHYGLAVHLVSFTSTWGSDIHDKKGTSKIKVLTLKKELLLNEKFKKIVLKEIEEKIDLVKSTKVYISSLSNVHDQIRKQIKENVYTARCKISTAITDYKNANSKKTIIGLYAYSIKTKEQQEEIVENYPLMLEWDDIRIGLEKKNQVRTELDSLCILH